MIYNCGEEHFNAEYLQNHKLEHKGGKRMCGTTKRLYIIMAESTALMLPKRKDLTAH